MHMNGDEEIYPPVLLIYLFITHNCYFWGFFMGKENTEKQSKKVEKLQCQLGLINQLSVYDCYDCYPVTFYHQPFFKTFWSRPRFPNRWQRMLNTKQGEAIRMALCFIISSQRLPPLFKKNCPQHQK